MTCIQARCLRFVVRHCYNPSASAYCQGLLPSDCSMKLVHEMCVLRPTCDCCHVFMQTDKEKYNLGNSNAFLYFSNDARFIVKTMEHVRI